MKDAVAFLAKTKKQKRRLQTKRFKDAFAFMPAIIARRFRFVNPFFAIFLRLPVKIVSDDFFVDKSGHAVYNAVNEQRRSFPRSFSAPK